MKYVLTAIDDWGRCYYNSKERDVVADIKNATLFDKYEDAYQHMTMFKFYLRNIKHDPSSFRVMEVSPWKKEIKPGILYSSSLGISQD